MQRLRRGAAIAVLAGLLAEAAAAAGENLVVNPGFERGQGQNIEDWSLSRRAWKGGAAARIDETERRSGRRSLLLELPEAVREGERGFAIVQQDVPVEAGESYDLSYWYKARGLVKEDRAFPERGYAHLAVWIFWLDQNRREVSGPLKHNWMSNTGLDAREWVRLENTRYAQAGSGTPFRAPEGAAIAALRFQMTVTAPEATPKVWVDDVAFVETGGSRQSAMRGSTRQGVPEVRHQREEALPANGGFEQGTDRPEGWRPFGSGKAAWVRGVAHGGDRSAVVTDTSDGALSGWATDVPVRTDQAYSLAGYIKAGGDLEPNGFLPGGALSLQFLDAQGQALGGAKVSPPVTRARGSGWTAVRTPKARPPAGAKTVRLVAGTQYCRGTAWFDDLRLSADQVEAVTVTLLTRRPAPSPGVRYAANLLHNGSVEEGEGGRPAGWTYVGRAEPDWTKEQIQELHVQGRPRFAVGRGRGEWAREGAYAGRRALLHVPVDPPVSNRHQWYGRNPVDGYWLSDPVPCEPGRSYLAAAWIRTGVRIASPWYGPLEVRFYDARERMVRARNDPVRAGCEAPPAGAWTWWVTKPYVAPDRATRMRLRVGQELQANRGSWGRIHADNLAVWEVPADAPPIDGAEFIGVTRFGQWVRAAHRTVKPPYLPAPAEAPAYECAWATVENAAPGNLFYDPLAPVPLEVVVTNVLGERRRLGLRLVRTDWLGDAAESGEVPAFSVDGYGEVSRTVRMPPTGKFGAFHVEVEVREGQAVVGRSAGRYAVLPTLDRPRKAENIFAVTPLVELVGDDRPFERELGRMLQVGGFGLAWVRLDKVPYTNMPALKRRIEEQLRVVEWYRSLGLRVVLQMNPAPVPRPVDLPPYEAAAKLIAERFKGRVVAIGNFGVESANSRSPYRGSGDQRLTDQDWDSIMAVMYDAIKSVDPSQTVLIGNIATDFEAHTIKRLYAGPGGGRFDGAIMNSYLGMFPVAQAAIEEFDAHGHTSRTIWQEECADQRSPPAGEARRYGEAEGPRTMVRNWLSLIAGTPPGRLKAVTMWGFVRSGEDDIEMVTPGLQPRPQFVAHAVMADALADARLVADRSTAYVTVLEWSRGDGPLWIVWANSGQRTLTLEIPERRKLTCMDLMGNRRVLEADKGLVNLKVDQTPVYLFGGGTIRTSRRLEMELGHGDVRAGEPALAVRITNNDTRPVSGTIRIDGPIEGPGRQSFSVEAGRSVTLRQPVRSAGLDPGRRTGFQSTCVTDAGARYESSASLNFAQAARAVRRPALDGTWVGWEAARPVPVVAAWQVRARNSRGERYEGPSDISGRIRLMWDLEHLYLGVDALDDVFVPVPGRGFQGFMGDSIEFAIQPQNVLSPSAPYFEYELYLPGGKGAPAASRRWPNPAKMIEDWSVAVRPTGERGNVVYQVAMPWAEMGVTRVRAGLTLSMAVVINDCDVPGQFSGARCRIRWFEGVDSGKNPEGYGDVTLVE